MFKYKYIKSSAILCMLALVVLLSSCEGWNSFCKKVYEYKLAELVMGSDEESVEADVSNEDVVTILYASPGSVPDAVQQSSADSYFDDALFVGNDIIAGFAAFIESNREEASDLLGKSEFFCAERFGVYVNNHVAVSEHEKTSHPVYAEQRRTVLSALQISGAKHVYICLAGLNDLHVYGDGETCSEKTAAEMKKLMDSILSLDSGIKITVLSSPYLSANAAYMKSLNNENIKKMNELIADYCVEINNAHGGRLVEYIDITTFLSNGTALKEEYCSDGYCNLSEKGCIALLEQLRFYAKQKKEGAF